ncbi:PLxRFG domain-containing protein [Xenophilus sp. Marseille-Q4582]|uniref:PLxRFG domain-containing protein n=1 Tax=Xenophilus sp. Marseille-Q4582 TaxID=2866600 RepID=UPI001CE3E2A8|nr:PLxRFG domain-containing protein [Xenophilus sp. Marseille-Q4582]
MDINQIRQQKPEWSDLDDTQVVSVLRQVYYPDMADADIAKAIGVQAPKAPAPERTALGTAGDVGLSLVKGAISVPEAAIGLMDIPTMGLAGKGAEALGFRPKEAKAFLDEQYSGAQQAANQRLNEAEGFGGKFAAALQNPSVIGHAAVESLPLMGAGGVVGRGVAALSPRVAPWAAAAAGEGVVGAGSAAEQIRQETPDGTLTGGQVGAALASGAGTAAFGALGGKIARSLGIADVDTMIVQAGRSQATGKGVVRRVLEGAVAEGLLEELPQSIHEQVMQNAALGRPLDEGVDQAAVLGLLTGAAMGGGANALAGSGRPAAANDPSDTTIPAANDPAVPTLALPAPTIAVGPDGVAATADQRQQARNELAARQGQIVERGPLSRATAAALGAGGVTDVALKPASAAVAAAATDTGFAAADPLAGQVTEPAEVMADPEPPVLDYADLSDEDRSAVDDYYRLLDDQTAASLGDALSDADIPDFGAASNVSEEDFLRALGASEQEIKDALSASARPDGAIQGAAGDAATQTNVTAGASQRTEPEPAIAEPAARSGPAARAEPKRAPEPGAGSVAPTAAVGGAQEGDITNKKGKPFTVRLPAINAAKAAGPGHEVVAVEGGFVVRKPASAAAPAIEGEDRGDGWTAFAKESGTLGVPRAEMPQIKAEHRGAMANFMNARGVAHAEEEVAADSLKPTQAEFSREKVEKAKAFTGGNRAILVSRDGHVLDGHHQWMAAREAAQPVRVIRLDAPVQDLLTLAREFPSSTTDAASAGQEGEQPPAIVEHTTGRGKVLRGVVRTDLDEPAAKAIDPYTFKKDGGWFIREKHLGEAGAAVEQEPMGERPAQASSAQVEEVGWEGMTPNQRRRSRLEREIATGETNNGGVTAALRPAAIEKRRQELADMGDKGQLPAAAPAAPQPAVKKDTPKQRAQAKQQAIADHYAPGNIVRSYGGGHDRVLAFTPPDAEGRWSVQVQAVERDGDGWREVAGSRPRTHGTEPSARELTAGPVEMAHAPANEPQSSTNPSTNAQQVTQEPARPTSEAPANSEPESGPNPPQSSTAAQANAEPAAAPAESSAPPAAVVEPVTSLHTGKPDPDNSGAMAELEGFQPGDAVDVEGRTIGRSTIEAVFRRAMKGIGMVDMARVVGADGKKLDVLISNLRRPDVASAPAKEAPAAPAPDKDGNTIVGRRADGVMIRQDARGVRWYAKDGVRISETVSTRPTREGIQIVRGELKPEFMTAQELAESGQNDELDAEMRSYEAKADQPQAKPGTVSVPPAVDAALTADMEKQQARVKRLRTAAAADGLTLDEKKAAQLKVTAAETTLRVMRTKRFDAEDAAVKAVADKDAQAFAEFADLFPSAAEAVQALMPAKKPATKKKPSAEETRAKADLMNALADLGDILGKSTRMNIVPEQEQKLLPVLTRVLDAAFRLGYHKFKDSAKFALDQIRQHLGDDAAEALTLDHLQGAYIAMAGGKQGADTKRAVIDVEEKSEIERHEAVAVEEQPSEAEPADTQAESKESNDAARQLDRAGARPLEGAPAEDVRPAGEGRSAGQGADGGRGGDQRGRASADDAGGDLAGSVGASARAVPVPAGGARADAADAKERRVPRARRPDAGAVGLRPQQQGLIPEGGPNPAPNAPVIPAPQATDFTIDADFALGEGGQKTKFKNNLAAIRLAKAFDADPDRWATPEEQRTLARYVGWGGLAQAFDANNADWAREHAELKELLTPEEYADAARSTRYAHYTSREVIVDGIYAALRRFGFAGGKILEAGAGVGNFLGLMPADMRSATRFTAIERDRLSSTIARQLYPKQNVQRADFTEFKGTDAYFDAAVGNPPFASDPQTDTSGRKHLSGLSLHNYFFAKAVDMLREGGVLAQVVTNSFLDAKADAARRYIADRTVFLGAIRLPNNAFSKNAGTEVTTDIIFLQKRPDGEIGGRAAKQDAKRWLNVGTHTDAKGREVALNQYFIDNPDMMLGEFGAYGTMYRGDMPALVAREGQDTAALLREAVQRLPEGVYTSIADTASTGQQQAAIVALRNPTVQEGGYYTAEDGKLMQRLPDLGGEARAQEITPATQWTEKTTLGDTGFARIKALSSMRATLRGLIAAEMADDDKGMGQLRARLNEQYDGYRKEHGLINDPSTLRVFEDDPDYPLLASLEHGYTPGVGPAAAKRQGIKPTKSSAKKAPIFDRRVVAARKPVRKVDSPADALAVSMAERGKLDASYIGKLLGRDPDDVLRELASGDKPALFRDPATDEYVLRDAYLSGNVRAKLAQARAAGVMANIRALEEVQPEDVGADQIVARVGSPWVPTKVYEDFASQLFGDGTEARITYVPLNSSFQVSVKPGNNVAFTSTFGTAAVDGEALLAALLNNRPIKVTYKDSEGKTHVNAEATEQANNKAQEIKEKFSDWLFADSDRSEMLVRAYNDTNNNYVTRVYDGSLMDFPGKVPDEIIKFRRHQRNAIARTVQDRTVLYDHVVGAGKTFTVVASAMELKRTGLARKPMVAVPNHLVKQWAADFYRLYPGANILTATKKDFERANRRRFLAKIATGDWDAVVIAHSSFGFIKPAPEFEAAFNRQEIAKITRTIEQVGGGTGDAGQKKRTVKQLEGLKERLENRIKALRDKPMDDLLDFEQIGVDQLFVDEFHLFKNLMFSTKMQNVQGLGDSQGSQRAYDMLVKINQIFAKNGRDQGFVAATGTPVSNSLAEMYHMMRYLMPTQMRELGFESFDAWANTFASVDQVWMQKPSGDGFKASSRMANFVNTPELLKMFDQVCDTVTMDDIKAAYAEENDGATFPLPRLKGDRRTPVSLEKTPAQEAYMEDLARRAQVLEARKGPPKKGEDNVLVIMGDGRKAAMDIRLVDPKAIEREPGGRIDRASDEIVARYQRFAHVKGTQLVFSDLGTPVKHAKAELKEYEALQGRITAASEDILASATLGNEAAQAIAEDAEAAQQEMDAKGADWLDAVRAAERGFSVYDDLRAALIEKGVPAEEIAFIHDFNTDEQKAALFRKVNAGDIRVVMGSTPKMGAGTNVQERLVALHHLDVPWKPSDVEQREGRIIRQGNVLAHGPAALPDFEVEVLAYVTKDTLDMRMWQVQETKLKMINQLRARKVGREVDNAFEDLELSAGEMQAAATGNIDLLHEIQLRTDVKKLEQRKRAFDASRNELESRRRRAAEVLQRLPAEIEAAAPLVEQVRQYQQDAQERLEAFSATIDGREFTNWREAQTYLHEIDSRKVTTQDKDGKEVERAAPIDVTIDGERYTARAPMAEAFSDLRGDVDPIVWTVGGEEYRRRARIQTAIRQPVVDAIADQTQKPLGTIGGFEVTAEGNVGRDGSNRLEVTLSQSGKVVASRDGEILDSMQAPATVVRWVDAMLNGLVSEHSYLSARLQRAQKEQADLDKTEAAGDWPDMAKLEDARGKHKAVLARLAGKGAKDAAAGTDPAFSRGAGAGIGVEQVAKAVQSLVKDWANAPKITVVASMSDPKVPERVRAHNEGQKAQGAEGEPEGFFYRGEVFIVADQMNSTEDVTRVLFHEVLGHYGLRHVFGADLQAILAQLATVRRGEVAAKARQYGLDMDNDAQRLMAAEEVLAEMAQTAPELGFVKRAIAAVRTWLRERVPALRGMRMTDEEIVRNFILPARRFVQRGGPGGGPRGGVPAFSMAEDGEAGALRALAEVDDFFALPKPAGTTLEEIVAEVNPAFKVRKMPAFAGRTDYQITAPDGMTARLMVRAPNPYGPQLYGYDVVDGDMSGQVTQRPGLNPEDVEPTGDVWIDVSLMSEGQYGAEVYQMAAAFAHNTGRIFIGDPAGLSTVALRRRLEQMISSALKFGTTAHLAPHPDQIRGGEGVPPLTWIYGDHVGNVRRMIAASVAAMDNAFPASRNITFDLANGRFHRSDTGAAVSLGQLGGNGARERSTRSRSAQAAQAGWRTVARTAVFRALLREGSGGSRGQDGRPAALLGGLLANAPQLSSPDRSGRIFYSRSAAAADRAGTERTAGLNDPRDFRAKAQDAVNDLFRSPGVVSWWHKSVGTMHDLAQRAPAFKRVYDAVQDFLQDVSFYATEAADLAPRILPKLDSIADLKKTALSAEDTKALSRPVFEGTLIWARDESGKLTKLADLEARYAQLSTQDKAQMLLRRRRVTPEQLQRWQASKLDVYEGAVRNRFEAEFLQAGVVFTDAELRQEFGATPHHISLYREFRAAADKSLNRLGQAEMLRFGGKDVAELRDMVMDAASAYDAAEILRDHLHRMADDQPQRRDVLLDTANKIIEKGDRINDLVRRGYAPLSRFGSYTLDVVDANGERVYFGMFEGRLERGAMARRMRQNFPGATVTMGTNSEQSYKLFNGITPETLELFGEMVGLEAEGDDAQHQMFQQYLKLAKSNRSAMKRLIQRKGIAGFSEDAGRVLAGFVYSNARLSSQNLHQGEITRATNDIPKSDGQLKDMAVRLTDYVRNPQEEAQALRGLLFTQYLGGSLASAMVNMTQPFAVTMPYLSQWAGVRGAATQMKDALRDVMRASTGDAKLDAALKKAEGEGIVAPQEVHQLLAQARGQAALKSGDGTTTGNARAAASNALSKLALAWGKPFSLAEQFNRRVTFIAAYRTAVASGIAEPAQFAEKAIADTQFVYNKGNKPQWARGPVGALAFTFKQYSISYTELLHRLATRGGPEGKRAAAFMLAMLFLMGGAGGLPFVEDAEDLLDGIAQRLGYSFSSKQARRQFLASVLGESAGAFVERGVSGLPGVPIDVAGRLGMGDLLPGTGLLTKKEDYSRDVAEFVGPSADLAQRMFQGADKALQGSPLQGAQMMAPRAAENLRKGVEMMIDGEYKDTRGRKVVDTTLSEAITKMIGFQPTDVSKVQEATFQTQRMVSQNRLAKQEFADEMAKAVYDRDYAKQQKVRESVREWNRRNPHSPITIDMAAVRRRVVAMRADKATRVEQAAPKAIRAEVRKQLQESGS